MNIFKNILLLLFLVLISSCSSNLKTEGNFIFPNNLDKLKTGMTKKQVLELLGPITIRANFNENTWYYIYEKSYRKMRFFNKSITDSKVIIINFDQDIVKTIKILTEKERRIIPVDEEQTSEIIAKTKLGDKRFEDVDRFK